MEKGCIKCGGPVDRPEGCEHDMVCPDCYKKLLEQMERENAVMIKPQPKGVQIDGWEI